jgi:hypothetical protein
LVVAGTGSGGAASTGDTPAAATVLASGSERRGTSSFRQAVATKVRMAIETKPFARTAARSPGSRRADPASRSRRILVHFDMESQLQATIPEGFQAFNLNPFTCVVLAILHREACHGSAFVLEETAHQEM